MECTPGWVGGIKQKPLTLSFPKTPVVDCAGTITELPIQEVVIRGVVNMRDCTPPSPQEDAMITCVKENTNLYIIDWSNETNTYKVYDFTGADVTGTVTPTKCEDSEITVEKSLVCDSGVTPLWQHTVYLDGNISNMYFTAIVGTTPVIPAGTITVGACPMPIYQKVIDGSILTSSVLGTAVYTFTSPVSNISITNDTNGTIMVTAINSIPILGNNTVPVGRYEAYQFDTNNATDTFTGVSITDINSTAVGNYLIRGTRF